MGKPIDVQLHRADGTVINCEMVYGGVDTDGIDTWLITGVVYRNGDRITVGVLPARTRIDFGAAP